MVQKTLSVRLSDQAQANLENIQRRIGNLSQASTIELALALAAGSLNGGISGPQPAQESSTTALPLDSTEAHPDYMSTVNQWDPRVRALFNDICLRPEITENGASFYWVNMKDQVRLGWKKNGAGLRRTGYMLFTGQPDRLNVVIRVGITSGLIGNGANPLRPVPEANEDSRNWGQIDLMPGQPIPQWFYRAVSTGNSYTRQRYKIAQP